MRGRVRAKRRRREDELEEEREQVQEAEAEPEQQAAAPPAPATLADKALDLQKTAGNRAVGAALDRWPRGAVDRAARGQVAEGGAGRLRREARRPDQELERRQARARHRRRAGAARRTAATPEGEGEIVIITEMGDYVVDLHKAALAGKAYGKVEIIVPGPNGTGIRVELDNVYIVSTRPPPTGSTAAACRATRCRSRSGSSATPRRRPRR